MRFTIYGNYEREQNALITEFSCIYLRDVYDPNGCFNKVLENEQFVSPPVAVTIFLFLNKRGKLIPLVEKVNIIQ